MIRINVGGHEYDSWDALPEEVRAQLIAAGVDPGPDGRLDAVDLLRAGGSVSRRTIVTGPGGAPLPSAIAGVLGSIADAFGPAAPAATRAAAPDAPETPAPTVPDDQVPDGAADDGDTSPGRSRRVPLVLGWIVIGATVLLVATVVVIGLSGI